nr:carbohydrate binding domain-containing protein [Lachnospiraceae bacterium]
MKKQKLLSVLLTGIMVFSFVGCTNNAQVPDGPVVPDDVEEPPTESWELPEVNWGDGLFDGKTLIDDHFEDDETFAWGTYSNGGTFNLYTENGEMVADIENTGSLDYACQLYRDDYELNQDGVYEISFTIRSDIDRLMQWRFQINGGDYHAYYMED